MHKEYKVFIWQGGWHGGAEHVTLSIAAFLKRTYDITPTLGVFAANKNPDIPFPQETVARIFPKRLVAYNTIAASILLGKKLKKYDLIITHAAGFWDVSGVPTVWREPGDLDMLFKKLPLKSKCTYVVPYLVALRGIRTSTIIVAASEKAKDFFARHKRRQQCVTSSNFLDLTTLPAVRRRQYSEGMKYDFVCIGRNDPIKNVSFLLKQKDVFAKYGIRLHLFGISGESDKTIIYHGWTSKDEVLHFLSQAHALVLPSHFEASPLVLFEALALGVPAIVSEAATPKEFKHLVSSYTSNRDFEATLKKILDSYKQVAEAAVESAEEVRTAYNQDVVLKEEFNAILRLL